MNSSDQSLIDRGLELCPACDYRLTGRGVSVGRCPECGWNFDEETKAWVFDTKRLWAWQVFNGVFLIVYVIFAFSGRFTWHWIVHAGVFAIYIYNIWWSVQFLRLGRQVVAIGPDRLISRTYIGHDRKVDWNDEKSVRKCREFLGTLVGEHNYILGIGRRELMDEFDRQAALRRNRAQDD